MKKKGLSNVIVTVLLVLLAIIAVAITWAIVRQAVLSPSGQVKERYDLIGLDFHFVKRTVAISLNQDVVFLVERGAGGENVDAFFVPVLEDSFGYSRAYYNYNRSMTHFQTIKVEINKSGSSGHGLPGIISRILLYPALFNDKGEIAVADAPSDVYEVIGASQQQPPPTVTLTLYVFPQGVGRIVDPQTGSAYQQTTQMPQGSVVTLSAVVENINYAFFNWVENGIELNRTNPLSINLTSNRTLTANYTLTQPPSNPFFLNACGDLNIAGGHYFVNRSITYTGGGVNNACFNVLADNIILEGQNFYITGNGDAGSYGVYAQGRANFTMKKAVIWNFGTGTSFAGTTNSALHSSTMLLNLVNGISLSSNSDSNLVNSSVFLENGVSGILISESSSNVIRDGSIERNVIDGIKINYQGASVEAKNNTIRNNLIIYNGGNGITLDDNANNNTITNTNNIQANNNGIFFRNANSNTITNSWSCYNIALDFECENTPSNNVVSRVTNLYTTYNSSCNFILSPLADCASGGIPPQN